MHSVVNHKTQPQQHFDRIPNSVSDHIHIHTRIGTVHKNKYTEESDEHRAQATGTKLYFASRLHVCV